LIENLVIRTQTVTAKPSKNAITGKIANKKTLYPTGLSCGAKNKVKIPI